MEDQLKMLDQAEAHFKNHRFSEGANLVWQASFQAIAEAAHALNLPCNNKAEAHQAAKTLDQIRPNPELRYINTLLHAAIYTKEAATRHIPSENQWEPDEYVEYLHNKRIMVNALNAIAKETIPITA